MLVSPWGKILPDIQPGVWRRRLNFPMTPSLARTSKGLLGSGLGVVLISPEKPPPALSTVPFIST